jgi:hypothetical protein
MAFIISLPETGTNGLEGKKNAWFHHRMSETGFLFEPGYTPLSG